MWFLIRHTETLSNKLNIQQGSFESLLTLKGIVQAQSISYKLQEIENDFSKYKFVSSPLVRTRHTTQIIMETMNLINSNELIIEPLIKSRSKGIFEEHKKDKIKLEFPEEYEKQQKDLWNYVPPNGESRAMVYERIKNFLNNYKNEEYLIIVSHNGILNVIKKILSGLTEFEISNSISNDKFKDQNSFFIWNKESNIINKI